VDDAFIDAPAARCTRAAGALRRHARLNKAEKIRAACPKAPLAGLLDA